MADYLTLSGDSICRPTNTNNVRPPLSQPQLPRSSTHRTVQVKVLATSSHNAPCMMYADPPGKGRVVIDCGFTKFYDPKWYEFLLPSRCIISPVSCISDTWYFGILFSAVHPFV